MNIETFLEGERKRLELFKKWWLENHAINPEHFPLEMGSGDWDSQLHFFEEI